MPLKFHQEDLCQYKNKLSAFNAQVAQIISSKQEDPSAKLALLLSLEQSEYQSLLRELSYKQFTEELQLLTDTLESVGDIKREIGKLFFAVNGSGGIRFYNESATYYEYVISILSERIDPSETNMEVQARIKKIQDNKLASLSKSILSEVTGKDGMVVASLETASRLAQSRNEEIEFFKTAAKDVEDLRRSNKDDEYIKASGTLFDLISENLKSTLRALYQESEQELSKLGINPPCSYSVIGFGSVALNQATPYSDFEFAIITEEKVPNDYFVNLTHLVHFKVIALGETKINNSLSHLIHRGRAFDSGGHTPLGGDGRLHLIGTVNELIKLLDKEEATDKLLPYILTKAIHITGEASLSTSYVKKVDTFLKSPSKTNPSLLNHEELALSVLKTEAASLTHYYDKQAAQITGNKPVGNLEEFRPLSQDTDGRLFNVKQEIYRLERLVHHLGMYFMQDGMSALEMVENLEKAGIINQVAASHLKFAVSFSSILRLNTYLINEGQSEDMSLFASEQVSDLEKSQQAAKSFHLEREDMQEDGALFKYFYTALEFHKKLEEFCEKRAKTQEMSRLQEQDLFNKCNCYDDSDLNKGLVHYRLMQYKEAARCFETVTLKRDIYTAEMIDIIGNIYIQIGQIEKAISIYIAIIESAEEESKYDEGIVYLWHHLGLAHHANGNWSEAARCFNTALQIIHSLYDAKDNECESYITIAAILSNLGETYRYSGQYYTAKLSYLNSLEYYQNKIVDQESMEHNIASVLNNLGSLLHLMGQSDEALQYYVQCLKIQQKIYKNEPHMSVASAMMNLGIIYVAQDKDDLALDIYNQSLRMFIIICRGENNSHVATCLNNLGHLLAKQGNIESAIECYDKSLKIRTEIYKSQPHLDVALSFESLGIAYDEVGDYSTALRYHQQSLEIKLAIYSSKPHLSIASSFNNIAEIYRATGDNETAETYYLNSLEQYSAIYGSKPNVHVAFVLSNLGANYSDKSMHSKAIECFTKALEILHHNYGDVHLSIASVLQNMALAYAELENYEVALRLHEDSLNMRTTLHDGLPHRDIFCSLHNLGNLWKLQKKYDVAINYYKKAIEICKQIGLEDQDVAGCFSNLGDAYSEIGLYSQSITSHNKALQIILEFSDHSSTGAIVESWSDVMSLLFPDLDTILDDIQHYTKRGNDFTDHTLHLAKFDKIKNTHKVSNKTKLMELELAWFFSAAQDNNTRQQTKEEVISRLSVLMTVSHLDADFILSVLENDLSHLCTILLPGHNINLDIKLDEKPLLSIAVARSQQDLVQVLLDAGASHSATDADGGSPLYYSLGYADQLVNLSIVHLLLSKGANPNQTMSDGDTPMHMAHYNGNLGAIRLLVAYGGLLTSQNKEGKTPLHCLLESTTLSSEEKASVVEALFDQYASCSALVMQDSSDNTPVDLASAASLPDALIARMVSITTLSIVSDDADDELTQALVLSTQVPVDSSLLGISDQH